MDIEADCLKRKLPQQGLSWGGGWRGVVFKLNLDVGSGRWQQTTIVPVLGHEAVVNSQLGVATRATWAMDMHVPVCNAVGCCKVVGPSCHRSDRGTPQCG